MDHEYFTRMKRPYHIKLPAVYHELYTEPRTFSPQKSTRYTVVHSIKRNSCITPLLTGGAAPQEICGHAIIMRLPIKILEGKINRKVFTYTPSQLLSL